MTTATLAPPAAMSTAAAEPLADTPAAGSTTTIRVYNTLTKTKEAFEPLAPPRVGMYLCGPTVYAESHIGHMVGPVIFDTVKRYLTFNGYDVDWVVNITDVDDKLIAKSKERGIPVSQIATEMTGDYLANLRELGVTTINSMPRATDHIPHIIEFIRRLETKGYAYAVDGDVFFDVMKDGDYGALSNRSADAQQGEGGEAAAKKRSAGDFALWKSARDNEIAWDSPWGRGRPGWHIECSAMSHELLGETFDIHGGGLDLMFPHHENELAQSECCHGEPFAKYWLHNGLMQAPGSSKVGGGHSRQGDTVDAMEAQEAGKLSGSQGAESVRTAVFAHHSPEAVRFFLLSTHYRSPIDFRLENIADTAKSLDGFYRLFETYERVAGRSFYELPAALTSEASAPLDGEPNNFLAELSHHRERFREVMDDDFNTGAAIGVLFELRRVLNGFISTNSLEAAADDGQIEALTRGMTVLRELSQLLGVFVQPLATDDAGDGLTDDLMQLVLELRDDMRATKNWDAADKIRDRLAELKVIVEDRPDGARWSRG